VRRTVLIVFGTRPEAIKLAPVIFRLRAAAPHLRTCVCVTAQHRQMLDQVLALFDVVPDHDLDLMRDDQSLFDVTERTLRGLGEVMTAEKPDLVLVQGDTTTTFTAALSAYYLRIPVGHVEAGLRTGDRYQPFPEEANRRLTDHLSTVLFAPTERARQNLLAEGLPPSSIFVTGNTAIDALTMTARRNPPPGDDVLAHLDFAGRRIILVTVHRRENFGAPLDRICAALRQLAETRPEVEIVYPVHSNPKVAGPVRRLLTGVPRIHLTEPLDYATFVRLMDRSYIILTDSGGIQEEAPSLGKPTLVLREGTERPEAVEAGTATVVGTDAARIVAAVARLLDDRAAYAAQALRRNPFGDGEAASRIVSVVSSMLSTSEGHVLTHELRG
jgi:UDP-N-acetylglucosamine 2-epimerase (non-hydrolysing)